jgi:hypothetical protein
VFVPDAVPIDLRIDQRSGRLDAVLDEHGAREWVFVTAWNPGAQRRSAEENARDQGVLLAMLSARGYASLPGSGIPAEPGWEAEESVLVLGMTRNDGIDLARQFGQVAIVAGKRGEAAELVYCS